MKHIKNNLIVYWYFILFLLILFAEIWLAYEFLKFINYVYKYFST